MARWTPTLCLLVVQLAHDFNHLVLVAVFSFGCPWKAKLVQSHNLVLLESTLSATVHGRPVVELKIRGSRLLALRIRLASLLNKLLVQLKAMLPL